jgi:hypothetical protein
MIKVSMHEESFYLNEKTSHLKKVLTNTDTVLALMENSDPSFHIHKKVCPYGNILELEKILTDPCEMFTYMESSDLAFTPLFAKVGQYIYFLANFFLMSTTIFEENKSR